MHIYRSMTRRSEPRSSRGHAHCKLSSEKYFLIFVVYFHKLRLFKAVPHRCSLITVQYPRRNPFIPMWEYYCITFLLFCNRKNVEICGGSKPPPYDMRMGFVAISRCAEDAVRTISFSLSFHAQYYGWLPFSRRHHAYHKVFYLYKVRPVPWRALF